MAEPQARELSGFDSFELKLGDQLRGERASLGKSLMDVQRELRIKAAYIDAIEHSDASVIQSEAYVAGYVRSYARYLGMDENEVFQRFCDESRFAAPLQAGRGGVEKGVLAKPLPDDVLGVDPYSNALALQSSGRFRPSLYGVFSLLALLALLAGIGYGAWTFLQSVQRISFAPVPEQPSVVATLPGMMAPGRTEQPLDQPVASDYTEGGALAEIYKPVDSLLPAFSPKDGPIAAIDPSTAGVFAPRSPEDDILLVEAVETFVSPIPSGRSPGPNPLGEDFALSADLGGAAVDLASGVDILALEESWVRINDANGDIVFTGIMKPGSHVAMPEGAAGGTLRVGNAGGIFVVVDGARYGPVGRRGQVLKNISLAAGDVRSAYPHIPVNSDDGASALVASKGARGAGTQ